MESEKNIYCFFDSAKASDRVDHKKLWEILKEIGIPGDFTCLLRSLYAGQEATIRTWHEATDCIKIGNVIIVEARFQQDMNQELPDVQAGFRKGRRTRDQIANINWIIKKTREFQKNIYFCFIDYTKRFDYVNHNKVWKILQEMGIPDHLTCSWEICMHVKKQQLELGMEQWTGSKLGKE